MLKRAFTFGFLAIFVATAAHAELSVPFDREKEFPNFFLPPAYRNTPPESVPREVVRQQKAKINAALQSLFTRLTIPIVPEGETKPRMVRYFSYLEGELKKIDPTVKVMPSGGVVRSAVGYLYAEMLAGSRRVPPKSPEAVLQEIIDGKQDMPGHLIRGVGSDFDVLLSYLGNKFKELKSTAARITNSAETLYEARNFEGGMKRSLFTVGDVKDYQEQTTRSTRQGGATVDFLAHDMVQEKLIEPDNFPGIVDDLVRGIYRYVPSAPGTAVEDGPKQTIRGIRPLIELPYLELLDDKQLRGELNSIASDLTSEKVPSNKAFEQFDKAVRNARFSGAHNRLHRGKPGSLEAEIAALFPGLEKTANRSTIPEFVDAFEFESRVVKPGLSEKLLMPMAEFIASHTDGGVLYHGTPEIENGLAMLRGGLFISKAGGRVAGDGRTVAVYGRGAYSSPEKAVSLGYAGSAGIVFELGVRTDQPLRILDWQKVEHTAEMQAIAKSAEDQKRDVFEVLSRDYGIDFIVNHHVLIQNLEAVSLPHDLKSIIHAYGSVMENPQAEPAARLAGFRMYRQLHSYSEALGETGVRPTPTFEQFMGWMLGQSNDPLAAVVALTKDSQFKEQAVELLNTHPRFSKQWRDLALSSLQGTPEQKNEAARLVLLHTEARDPANHAMMSSALAHAQALAAETKTSLLTVLREDFNLPLGDRSFSDWASKAGAPTEFGALALWLEKLSNDPTAKGSRRLEAFRYQKALRPLAEFTSELPLMLSPLPEERFVETLFENNSRHPFEPFATVLNSSYREAFEARIQDDRDFRDRFRAAARAGLESTEYARKALDAIENYLPDTLPEDRETHRLALLAGLGTGIGMDTYSNERMRHFYSDPATLEKILFSNDPRYTRFVPALAEALQVPLERGGDAALLKLLLPRAQEIIARHPAWKKAFDRAVRNQGPGRRYSDGNSLNDAELESLVRAYDFEAWKEIQKAMLTGHGGVSRHLGLGDPQVAALIDGVITQPPVAEWRALLERLAPLNPQLGHPWLGDAEQIEQLKRTLPQIRDAKLRREAERLWKLRNDARHAAYGADHMEGFFDLYLKRPGAPTIVGQLYEIALGKPELKSHAIDRLKEGGVERDWLVLRLMDARYQWGRQIEDAPLAVKLRSAVAADPVWKRQLRERLDVRTPLAWGGFPFDLQSPEDRQVLKRFFETHRVPEGQSFLESARSSLENVKKELARRFGQEAPPDLAPFINAFLNTGWRAGRAEFPAVARIDDTERGHENWGFLEDAAQREAFQKQLREDITRSNHVAPWLHKYPWSLARPGDAELLKLLEERFPDRRKELVRLAAKLEAQYGTLVEYGTLVGDTKSDSIETNRILFNHIHDASDLDRLGELLAARNNFNALQQELGRLARREPLRFFEHYPQHVENQLPHLSVWSDRASFNGARPINEALEAVQKERATPEQRQLIEHYLKRRDWRMFAAMIYNEGPAREWAFKALGEKLDGRKRLWLALLDQPPRSYSGPNDAGLPRVREVLGEYLKARPALRAEVRDLFLSHPTQTGLAGFPWDLKNRGEAAALARVVTERGWWGEDFIDELARSQPEAFASAYRGKGPSAQVIRLADQRASMSEEQIERLESNNFHALSEQDQADFERFLAQPFGFNHWRIVRRWIGRQGAHGERLRARLLAVQPKDDLLAIAHTWRDLQEDAPALFRKEKSAHSEYFERLRSRLWKMHQAQPVGSPPGHENVEIWRFYPWDVTDAKDIAMLQKLEHATANAYEVRDALQAREWASANYAVPGKNRTPIQQARADADALAHVRYEIEPALFEFARHDFAAFEKAFPHLPLPTPSFWGSESLSTNEFGGAEKIFQKLAAGEALDSFEEAVKELYLQRGNPQIFGWMLGHEGLRAEALQRLKDRGDFLVLHLLSPNRPGWMRSTREIVSAIQQDPAWFDKLSHAIDDPTLPKEVWAEFDLYHMPPGPARVRLARGLAKALEGDVAKEYPAFIEMLKTEHGIEVDKKDAGPLSDAALPPQLLARYRKLRDAHVLMQKHSTLRHLPEAEACDRAIRRLAAKKYWNLPE